MHAEEHGDPAEEDRGLGGMLPGSSNWELNMNENISCLKKYTFWIHLLTAVNPLKLIEESSIPVLSCLIPTVMP